MNLLRYFLAIALALGIHGIALSYTEQKKEINTSLNQQNSGLQLQIMQVAPAAVKPQTQAEKLKKSSNTKNQKKAATKKVVDKKTAQKQVKQATKTAPTKKPTKPLLTSNTKVQKKSNKQQKAAKNNTQKQTQVAPAAISKQDKKAQEKNKLEKISEKEPELTKTAPPVDLDQKQPNKQAQSTITQTSQSKPKLVKKPQFAAQPAPASYPKLARKRGWQGIVLIEILIDEQGQQVSRNIIQSAGHQVLDNAALKAVKKWQFSASTENGKAVPYRTRIPINFKLN